MQVCVRGWSAGGRSGLGPWRTFSSEALVGVREVTWGSERQGSEKSFQEDSPERKSSSRKKVHYSDWLHLITILIIY